MFILRERSRKIIAFSLASKRQLYIRLAGNLSIHVKEKSKRIHTFPAMLIKLKKTPTFQAGKVYKFLAVFGIILLADQITKQWILFRFPQNVLTNAGIAFGILPNFGFYLVILTLVLLILYFTREKKLLADDPTLFAAASILAGSISNFIDRLRYGYVVDFISLPFWPAFNLADVAIVLGSLIMVIRIVNVAKD